MCRMLARTPEPTRMTDPVSPAVTPVPPETVSESVQTNGPRMVDYALLLKPRVMSLVIFTGFVGLILAPGSIDLLSAILAVLFISLGAGAAGAINMWYDRDIDFQMERTRKRPIPAGRLAPVHALWLGTLLSIASVVGMGLLVNAMSALLLAITIAFYIFVYTIWLKRRTPQNIVIGGAAGAFPPMIGWAAVTGDVGAGSLILFAIIFMWTPPHFWALSLYRSGDYEKAGIPMLPVVSGVRETKKQMLIYAALLIPITVLPAVIGLSSIVAGVLSAALGFWFQWHAVKVWRSEDLAHARAMFRFSLLYLFLIFVILLADHGIAALI